MGRVDYIAPDRVIVTAVPNAVDPLVGRVTRAFAPGRTVRDYVQEFWPLLPEERSLMVGINGVAHDGAECLDVVMLPNDSLAFMLVPGKGGGGGKNPVMMVAMIALTIYTGGGFAGEWLITNNIMGMADLALAMDLSATAAFTMAGVAATVVGGAVMSAVTSTLPSGPSTDTSASLDSSSTYSWGLSNNPVVEGGACPYLFGSVRITPPRIGIHVSDAATTDTDNKNQYLNMLFLVADHQVDSISDIWLNGNPVSFYTDVTVETRLGTLDQTAVSFMSDTISQKGSQGVLSSGSYVSVRTDGNAVEGLGVCFANDQGLFHAVGSTTAEQSVTVTCEYRKVGSSTWLPFFDNGTSVTKVLTGNSTSALYHYFRLDNLPDGPGQYEVQAHFYAAPPTDVAYKTRTILAYIHEILYDALVYPGRAILGIRIKATDQLSGSAPSVSCLVARSTVSVSDGTDSYTKTATNPAWAALELLQNTTYGGQVAPGRCIWDDFESWADWCTSKGYTTNYYADTSQSLPRQLAAVGIQGRGQVVQFGSRFTPIVDRPVVLPRQGFLFNVSNMRDFSESWAPLEGRANVIEVTYFDASADFSRQVVPVRAVDFDTTDIEVVTQSVALPGCTDRAQALAYGQFLINSNRYLTNTITFVSDVQALSCTIGDVVDVQHAVPQWGFGGRVVSATATHVTLDQTLTMVAGTSYALQVKRNVDDSRTDVNLVTVPGDSATFEIQGAWGGDPPEADDLFAFGPVGYVSKQFRIVSMQRNGDHQKKLKAVEYYEPVYNDAVVIPAPVNQSMLPGVYALLVSELYDVVNGWAVPRVGIAWKGAVLAWDVAYRILGEAAWTPLGRYTYPGAGLPINALVPGTTYEVKVTGGLDSSIQSLTYLGGPVPPDVSGLYSFLQTGRLYLAYDAVDAPYSVYYEVRKGTSWDTAQIVYYGLETTVQLNSSGYYLVRAYTGTQYSVTSAALTVTDEPLIANVIATWDEAATGWLGTRSAPVVVVGSELWLVGDGDAYASADIYAEGDIWTLGGVASSGTYQIPASHVVELDASAACNVVVSYDLRGEGVFADIYDDVDIYTMSDVFGGYGAFVSAQPQIRTHNGSTWSDWMNYRAGTYTGQKFDARIVLYSTSALALAILSEFTLSVDVPDRTDWHKGVLVPAEGYSYTHTPAFHAVPSTVVQILSATQGDDVELTAETVDGGTLVIYNDGVAVARYVNLIHQGY